jgi:peptide/nickel transport system substrate-binding protein
LLSGDVDIINELPPSAIKQVSASGRATVMAVDGTRTFFVAMNLAKQPFDDARVRRALNYAVNRRLIIDKVLDGTATPVNGVLSPAAFAFAAELPEYAYDPEKAKALFAEAGYPQGFAVTIDSEGAFKDQAEAVAALLRRVGVTAKVQVWEGAVLTPIWRDPARRRDHDMYFTSWGNAALDPSDIMVPTLRTGGRGNSSGYSNGRVDALLDAADTESDGERRRSMYIEAQAIVGAEAPFIFLWVPQDIYGVAKRVIGFRPAADGRINLAAVSVR